MIHLFLWKRPQQEEEVLSLSRHTGLMQALPGQSLADPTGRTRRIDAKKIVETKKELPKVSRVLIRSIRVLTILAQGWPAATNNGKDKRDRVIFGTHQACPSRTTKVANKHHTDQKKQIAHLHAYTHAAGQGVRTNQSTST